MHERSLESAREAQDMIVLCLYYSRRAKACFPIQDSLERMSAVVIFRMSRKGPQYMSYYPNHEWFILIVLWHITLEEFLLVTFVARLQFFVRECDAHLNLQSRIGSRN